MSKKHDHKADADTLAGGLGPVGADPAFNEPPVAHAATDHNFGDDESVDSGFKPEEAADRLKFLEAILGASAEAVGADPVASLAPGPYPTEWLKRIADGLADGAVDYPAKGDRPTIVRNEIQLESEVGDLAIHHHACFVPFGGGWVNPAHVARVIHEDTTNTTVLFFANGDKVESRDPECSPEEFVARLQGLA